MLNRAKLPPNESAAYLHKTSTHQTVRNSFSTRFSCTSPSLIRNPNLRWTRSNAKAAAGLVIPIIIIVRVGLGKKPIYIKRGSVASVVHTFNSPIQASPSSYKTIIPSTQRAAQNTQQETMKIKWVDEAADEGYIHLGCGRNCLNICCIAGAKLPLYAFNKKKSIVGDNGDEKQEAPVTFLDSLVRRGWEDRMKRGLFRYDLSACESKVVSGQYGFIAQLNEGRHLKKRLTEFGVDKVLQPFDRTKFNFTKITQEELLFQFEASEEGEIQFHPNAPIYAENSPSVVAINVSPIEYGHVLLIPRIFECLPQRIDRESLWLALNMAAEAGNPYFRLGYNSLGAFASINHLHFQGYYLDEEFPIEKAPTKKLVSLDVGVKISEVLDYPVRCLVFEGGSTLEDLSNPVSDACVCLQDNNIPYNVLIAECGKRIFVLPQCYAEKQALGEVRAELLDTMVNPACWEIGGHMLLKRKKDYDEACDENAWELLAEVSLSEERFQEVMMMLKKKILN